MTHLRPLTVLATLAVASACAPARTAAPPPVAASSPDTADAPPNTEPDADEERGLIVLPKQDDCHAGAELAEGALVAATVCARVGPERWAELRDGAVLYPGDGLVVYVEVARRSHVHLVQRQHSTTTLIWPTRDDSKILEPGDVLEIPGPDHTMELDDDAGRLQLFVIASDTPLREVDDGLADLLEGLGARPHDVRQPVTADVPPPARPRRASAPTHESGPLPTLRERGTSTPRPGRGRQDVSPDEQGVAIVRFRIDHRRR